jgi:NAD(P)-dependent dehydrogenase (short-subunit alcohol dehydrogenase family)
MSTILVTGTSTGIGAAIVKVLARSGHRVYATMRNLDKSTTLKALAEKEKLDIRFIELDVNSDASVKAAFDNVLALEEHLDVLVNNAGIGVIGAVEEVSLDLHRAAMETNYFGAVRCMQAVLPSMRERRAGTIINIASVAGKVYGQAHGAYCASKAAIEAISECLAQEVAPFGIRVAVVEPGVIETPIFTSSNPLPHQTNYPNSRRLHLMFLAALEKRVQPEVVGEVVRDIVEGRSTAFRNPAGPDAEPFLNWRRSTPDEQWVMAHAIDDETWIQHTEAGFGIDIRKHL